MTEGLTIGQAAARLQVTARTLRHWEQIGLAPAPGRSRAGYRRYREADLERLQRIVVYRELGLSLEQICSPRHPLTERLDLPASQLIDPLGTQVECVRQVPLADALLDKLGHCLAPQLASHLQL